LLAPVTDGLTTYIQQPLAIGRRDCTGRNLNEKNVSNGQQMLADPVKDGLSTYVQEPLAIGRRDCTGRNLKKKH
jgi:hypothetical protein